MRQQGEMNRQGRKGTKDQERGEGEQGHVSRRPQAGPEGSGRSKGELKQGYVTLGVCVPNTSVGVKGKEGLPQASLGLPWPALGSL